MARVMLIAATVGLLVGAGAALAGVQDEPRLTMRLQFPTGEVEDIHNLRSGTPLRIQFLYREEFHSFQLVPRLVVAGNPNRVTVTIRQGEGEESRVVADLYLAEGQDVRSTGTSPSLGVAVLHVER